MVQRKVSTTKLGIQAEHVKSDKRFANLKPSSSQHQDGKSRGSDMKKKKMKKSRSIKLSDLEALQSSPSPASRRSLSQPGKPPPHLHVPTTAPSTSPQKQHPLVRTTDGSSPNYMKPTSSSHAKKELFPVSLRNTQSGSDSKNLPRKSPSESKATCGSSSSRKPAKNLTRSSTSLSLVRTLTKTTSFKASRACPRKSTRAAMCADMNGNAQPHRATCSSTLKDSKFPAYLMLYPGGTESEGTSFMKVCPYTYCSLNGHHHHADLPPLKSFISARRRLVKTQKRVKLEALSPKRLKVAPCETEKTDSGIDEIGMDIFIEIYADEKDAEPTGSEEVLGKTDSLKEVEDQEDTKSTIEDNGIAAAGEEGVKQVMSHIDLEEDLKKSFDDVVDTKGCFQYQEQDAVDADEDQHQPSWSHEEMSMRSYCSDDEEHNDMDDSDSKAECMEWEEEQFCGFNHEDANSEDSKVESLSESSHDVSVTWLDDILSCYYEGILVDETLKEAKSEESTRLEEEEQPPHDGIISSVLEDTSGTSTETQETGYPSGDMACESQSSLAEETFEYLTNAEDFNGGENEKQVDDVASCSSMKKTLDEETDDNSQCQEMSETCISEENQTHLFDVPEESNTSVEEDQKEVLEKDQGKGNKLKRTSCIGGEEQNTSEDWRGAIRRKRCVEDDSDDEMRKFNPREPNFLPLVPEPEPEKVDLRHQMMDERKNAEEWMLDCALRQVVTKLAPARKKKVALLVEAFETVMPTEKCETRLRNNSAFAHARRIQACS